MGRGEDFAICYAEDVRWTTFDGGTVVSGPTEVRDYLNGLPQNMSNIQTGPLAYGAATAYIDGDCADPRNASTDRLAFFSACGQIDAVRVSHSDDLLSGWDPKREPAVHDRPPACHSA